MKPRPRNVFSEQKVIGLRSLGMILSHIRKTMPDASSYRRFSQYLTDLSGSPWHISSLQRYEGAGTPDPVYGYTRIVHPEYLVAIEPLSPYGVDILEELAAGLFDSDAEPLGSMLERLEQRLGATQFKTLCKKFALTSDDIAYAKKGLLRKGFELRFSLLLDQPPEVIIEASLLQVMETAQAEHESEQNKN